MNTFLASPVLIVATVTAQADPVEDAAIDELDQRMKALFNSGDAGGALPLALEVRKRRVALHGEGHVNVARSDLKLGLVYSRLGDDRSTTHQLQAITAFERIDPHHPLLVTALSAYGSFLASRRQYEQAVAQYEKALDVVARLDEPDPSIHASILTDLAPLIAQTGDRIRPMQMLEEALRIRRAAGDDGPGLGTTLLNLGDRYRVHARFEDAISMLEEACAVLIPLVGEAHPNAIAVLGDLALARRDAGDLRGAREGLEQVLAVQRRTPSADPRRTVSMMITLAAVFTDLYEIVDARALLEEAQGIVERILGPDHLTMASVLSGLAGVETAGGDSHAAKRLSLRALEISEAALDPDDPGLIGRLTRLANAELELGEHESALAHHQRALENQRAFVGQEHPSVAMHLHNIGVVYLRSGQLDEAEASWKAALQMRRKFLGEESPQVAVTLGRLAAVHDRRGHLAEAAALQAKALAINIAVLGEDHFRVTTGQVVLAEYLLKLDRRDEALELYDRATMSTDRGLRMLDGLSERKGRQYILSARPPMEGWLLLADGPEDTERAWARAMRFKGAVAARKRRAMRSPSPAAAEVAAELAEVRRTLSRVVGSGGEPTYRAEKIGELTPRADALELELSRLSASFQAEQAQAEATPADLCKALGRGATLVDFFRTEHYESRYIAFVVDSNCQPHRIELGSAPELDATIASWRALLASPTAVAARTHVRGKAVAERLLAPLEPYLDRTERLIVVPDGPLASVPFAALPFRDGRLVQHMQVSYLDRAADVLDAAKQGRGAALVIGGVDFGAPVAADPSAECRTRTDWSPLPATSEEADAVAAVWRGPVSRLGAGDATVSAVQEAMADKALLHLATHGLFATGEDCLEAAGEVVDPMLLSGLVLADANGGGGVLTASEVADLDLSNTALVTLSACETGLGEIQSGEGVLGLRRGFSIAGAGSLLLSLWSVGDESTSRLMGDFYANYRGGKRHPAEALRRAQLAAIRRGESTFSWAAFVASGADEARR